MPTIWETVETEREAQESEWWLAYKAYLLSPEWKAKRDKVLRRDDYLCQACLEFRATQAHHLTYDHLFNEPLFDLVAVCDPCHEEITETERNNGRNAGSRAVLPRRGAVCDPGGAA